MQHGAPEAVRHPARRRLRRVQLTALTNLLSSELSIRLPKGDRLTDWLIRPLSDEQRAYAASDVAHLLELREKLVAEAR